MNIDASANPQTAIMNKLMLYMFPLFVVVGGPFFPLAILFYWLANNSWTFGQLRVAHTMQDRRAAAKAQVVEEVKDLSKFSTPKPGAKPKRATGRPTGVPTSPRTVRRGRRPSPNRPAPSPPRAPDPSAPSRRRKTQVSAE